MRNIFVIEIRKAIETDAKSHYTEIIELTPKAVRLAYLLLKTGFIIFLSLPFGVFMISLYLWGERGLGETLTTVHKFCFWSIALPLSIGNFLLVAFTLLTYRL